MAQGSRTVLDGVYTDEQAARGEADYRTYCTGCHEGADADGPALMGRAFLDRWREDSLDSLFTFMRNNMPGNRPGGLEQSIYLDIIAFLLKTNEIPPGKTELTVDVVGRTQLVGKDGPQPFPNLTVVRAVGCLAAGTNGSWVLAKASEPVAVRARNVGETTPEELKAAAALPLGHETLQLQNVPARAQNDSGHKVQAKGVLIRRTDGTRINVIALESVATACGE
jgi:hypothetical protein